VAKPAAESVGADKREQRGADRDECVGAHACELAVDLAFKADQAADWLYLGGPSVPTAPGLRGGCRTNPGPARFVVTT
jgi:hypothetical protein